MADTINRVAWDGAWYARAYDDDGLPVGVSSEPFHKINLIVQAWAVLGEAAPADRARKAMLSADAKLGGPYGLAILWPAYQKGTERVRGTSTYPPGAKENGGIFCHANTWAIIAAAKLGWADRALEYYHRICPLSRQDTEVQKTEPYVFCGNITGPEHRRPGEGRNAWLSGTASWAYVAATQHILGIRPTFRGLQVAPVLPTAWSGYTATRVFRGVSYDITVTRQGKNRPPQAKLIVDGEPVQGNVVPLPPEGTDRVEVQIVLE
jgi:cellobiose phosphorylase